MATKVIYVITKSNWGGAQRYVFDLATNLPKNEFEVAVALGGNGLLAQKLKEAGIMIYHNISLERDISFIKDIRSFFALLKIFKKEKPDVVHLNSSKAGGLGALAARLAGVQNIIFTAHGWAFRENRNIVTRGILWLISYLTAVLCDTVICVSDYDLRQAQHMPGVKAVRIYNGINQAITFDDGEKIRSAFPAGIPITGTVGELTKNKNQITLIKEARQNPNMYVAIVGEGELRAELEAKIKEYNLSDRVKLFGFMPATEAMKGFDTFALPSLKEGLPYVLIEAKLAGLPLTANPVGGIPEILEKDLREFTLEKMVAETTKVYRSRH